MTERQNTWLACWRSWVQSLHVEHRKIIHVYDKIKNHEDFIFFGSPTPWQPTVHLVSETSGVPGLLFSQICALVEKQEVAVSSSNVVLPTKEKCSSQAHKREIML